MGTTMIQPSTPIWARRRATDGSPSRSQRRWRSPRSRAALHQLDPASSGVDHAKLPVPLTSAGWRWLTIWRIAFSCSRVLSTRSVRSASVSALKAGEDRLVERRKVVADDRLARGDGDLPPGVTVRTPRRTAQ